MSDRSMFSASRDRRGSALLPRAGQFIALLGLSAAYIQGGLTKLFDFSGAIAEAAHFGLPFPVAIAVITIVLELGASFLILSGRFRWAGALALAGFTLMATFIANRFWELPVGERFMVENSFFEHLGLVGGFLFVALWDLGWLRSAREA
jgi:uncharacterized membrane protein YphA (DoxX/SURF4 family)